MENKDIKELERLIKEIRKDFKELRIIINEYFEEMENDENN
jgi:hypothetical protein